MTAEAEIAALRRRLEEAEETLRAIRNGEVDALVMRDGLGDDVFTIGGDAENYRKFIEAMEPGAAVVDAAGRVLYANAALCALAGQPLAALQGRPLAGCFAGRLIGDLGFLLSAPLSSNAGDGRRSAEIVVRSAAGDGDRHVLPGDERHFTVVATPVRLGTVAGIAITFTDLTARVRAERAERAEQVAKAIIASAAEAVLVCDRAGIITHANLAAGQLADAPLVGRAFEEAVPLGFPFGTGLMAGGDLIALAVAGGSIQGIEVAARAAPKVQDYLVSAAPLQIAPGEVTGCVLTMVDLSARKAAEKQQLLLMRELDHRVKNTLALVLSISNRTLSIEDTLEGFQTAFTARIQALAATHTLLAQKSWSNLSLRDVLTAEVAPYADETSGRVRFVDVDVDLAPRSAIALGLIFHELATNAVKYGALSAAKGVVTVRTAGAAPGRDALRLVWSESGGPVVGGPRRHGFGRTVIARSLGYSPNGAANLAFAPEGIVCTIDIPGEDLA
jgi:PAS domain S-box-containing protein